MDKMQFIYDTAEKVNAKKRVTQSEINAALNCLHELVSSGQYSGTNAEARTIGGLLSAALSKAPRK